MSGSFYRSTIHKANDRNIVVVRRTLRKKKTNPFTMVSEGGYEMFWMGHQMKTNKTLEDILHLKVLETDLESSSSKSTEEEEKPFYNMHMCGVYTIYC